MPLTPSGHPYDRFNPLWTGKSRLGKPQVGGINQLNRRPQNSTIRLHAGNVRNPLR